MKAWHWIVIGALTASGFALLMWWVTAVTAFGVAADAGEVVSSIRVGDIALLAGGLLCLAGAVGVLIVVSKRGKAVPPVTA